MKIMKWFLWLLTLSKKILILVLPKQVESLNAFINTTINFKIGYLTFVLGEFFQCLALDAIANIGGKEMAESLAPVVQKLLVANTSPPHVKKRAALALLR